MGSSSTFGAWDRIFSHDELFIAAGGAGAPLMACWRAARLGATWERRISDYPALPTERAVERFIAKPAALAATVGRSVAGRGNHPTPLDRDTL